jgi:WhiB family redox-sensing transcriptional regulator
MSTKRLPTAQDLCLDQRPDWTLDALCAQVLDDEIFFPPKGGSTREAKSICAQCPVKAECLAFALENGERFGIFGGLSERERRRLKGADRCPTCHYWLTTPAGLVAHIGRRHPELAEAS